MCHENTQVEFEFGSGRIIFGIGVRQVPYSNLAIPAGASVSHRHISSYDSWLG